jgi:hypothetical protein
MAIHFGPWAGNNVTPLGSLQASNTLLYSDTSNPQSLSISMTQWTNAGYQTSPANAYAWSYTNAWTKMTTGGHFGVYHGTPTPDPAWYTIAFNSGDERKFIFKRFKMSTSYRTNDATFNIYGSNNHANSGPWTLLHAENTPDSTGDYSFTNAACYRLLKFEWVGFLDNSPLTYDWVAYNFEMYGDTYA